MTAIRRYTEEQFSDILKVWFDYEEPQFNRDLTDQFNNYQFDPMPEIFTEVNTTLRFPVDEYLRLELGYKKVLKQRGSDYFDYLTDRSKRGGSFKQIGFTELELGWTVELLPEHPIIHVLEVSFEHMPLYVNSPVKEIREIAKLLLKFGK